MKPFTMPNHFLSRAVTYLAGILLLMFGTALSIRSDLGTTCSASLGQNLSLLTGISLGTVLLWINLFLVAVQLLLTRRHNYLQIFMQIPVNLLSSCLVDGFLVWIGGWSIDTLFSRWFLLLLSIPMVGLGAVCTIAPNFSPTTPDGLVQTISQRFHWKLSNIKNVFDLCQVTAAALLYYGFRKNLGSVNVGTVLSALLIGRFVAVFMKALVPRLPFSSAGERE